MNTNAHNSQWLHLARLHRGHNASAAGSVQASREDNNEGSAAQPRTTSSRKTQTARKADTAKKPAIQAMSMPKKRQTANGVGNTSSKSDALSTSRAEVQPPAALNGKAPVADPYDPYYSPTGIGQYELRRQKAEAAGKSMQAASCQCSRPACYVLLACHTH